MSTIVSPMMRNDFVTKKEFGEFRFEVNGRFDDLKSDINMFKEEIKDDVNRHIGMIYEQSRHDLKLATEYLESVIKKDHEQRQ